MNKLLNMHPVPGMSLAGELGNKPWEQPPMFVELDDVVNYYVEKMTEPKAVEMLLKAMQTDAPLVSIANVAIKAAMMKGIHNIDVGIVALPIIVELMKTIGDMNDVGYVVSPEDYEATTEIDEDTARQVLKEAVTTVKENIEGQPQEAAGPRKGLMAKGAK